MGSNIVKLVIELENRVKAQLEQINKQMRSIEQESQKVSNAMRNVDSNAFNRASNDLNKVNAELSETVSKSNASKTAFSSTSSTATSSFSNIKSKISSINPSINTLKQEIVNLGASIKSSISGVSFDSLKSKITGLIPSVNQAKASISGMDSSVRTAGGGLNFLSSAASMTVGMIGYDLVNSMVTSARESLNAAGNFQAFGQRMNMTAVEIDKFGGYCDKLQKQFQKVDMNAVGAAALELGVKLKLPKESMEELTKTTAVMSSAFVKEGRTQTDAILAVSDALDGQFRRLQELGISQEMLKNNGWDGDIENKTSLLEAMNRTLDDMGFTETASQVNTLDEAYQMLTVEGGKLLSAVLVPMTPIIIDIVEALVQVIDGIKGFVDGMVEAYNSLPDWAKETLNISLLTTAIMGVVTAVTVYLIPTISVSLMNAFVTLGSFLGVTIVPELATLSGAFMTLAGSIWGAIAPMLPFVLAAVGIGVAVYEIGKAFDWWTDVSSMIYAICSGLGRLWDAFVNHPDVQAIVSAIAGAWQWLNDILHPIFEWLSGVWDSIFPPDLQDKFDIVSGIIYVFGEAWEALTFPIRMVVDGIKLFLSVITGDMEGARQAGVGTVRDISDAFSGMSGQLLNTIPGVRQFSQLLARSILWILDILGIHSPGIVQNKILEEFTGTLIRIGGLISGFFNTARQLGLRIVNGVVGAVTGIAGKVYNEFIKIGSRIIDAGKSIVSKAKHVGKSIVDGVLGAMGIHSPGIVQEKVVAEFENMINRVADKKTSAENNALQLGKSIVDGFSKADVEGELNHVSSNMKALVPSGTVNAKVNVDNSGFDNVNTDYSGLTGEMQLASESIISSNESIGSSFTNMASSIGLDTDVIQTRIAGVVSSFNTTRIGVNSSLSNMETNNKLAWTSITTDTQNNLNQMYSSTANVTKKLTGAWNTMKDNIVSAAADLKSKSNVHFNSLSSNIGSFYRHIQNPSLWAGPSNAGRSLSMGRVSRGAGRLRSIINGAVAGAGLQYAGTAHISKLADSVCSNESCKEFYLTGNNNHKNFDIEEFYRRRNNNYAGWWDWSSKHLSYIKKHTGNWNMKGPIIKLLGGIPTGLAFNVKQFENGAKPNMGLSSFQKVAEAIFSNIPYDYYFNSDKTGDPISALQSGSCNCWDGAHALMQLANVFGLSASLGRGTGHVWAVIGGKTFDTTNYQLHRSWSPLPGYTGPSTINRVKDTADSVEKIKLDLNQNININITNDGVADVDEDTIINALKQSITDNNVVDKIANALIKRDAKIRRMGV